MLAKTNLQLIEKHICEKCGRSMPTTTYKFFVERITYFTTERTQTGIIKRYLTHIIGSGEANLC